MFLETRLDLLPAYGATVDPQFDVRLIETASGDEYRTLANPYPRAVIELNFPNRSEAEIMDTLLDLYQQVGGQFGGFRFRNWLDYSSNGRNGTPTFNDQACTLVEEGVYQLVTWYGTESDSTATRRRVRKPVAGTVLVGIRDEFGVPHQVAMDAVSPVVWSVDATTGLVTFAGNRSGTITNITQSAEAEISIPFHDFSTGDSVHIDGVAGMTEINGRRGTVVGTIGGGIVVDINTTGFTAYASSSPNNGRANTRPQSGETVTAGFEYDLPVRFDTNIPAEFATRNPDNAVMNAPVTLIEQLNPDA